MTTSAPKPRPCPHGRVWLVGEQTCLCESLPASEPPAMDREAQIRCFRDLEFGPLDVALAHAMEAARQAAMHRGLADTAGKLQWLNGIAACEKVELSNRWKEVRPSDQPGGAQS